MKNEQLHILSDGGFARTLSNFAAKHKLKKTEILKKAIAALRFSSECEALSSSKYKKDVKPHFDETYNHFFTVTEEENFFLEHCAKVNGYCSKSDFARNLMMVYMSNVEIMGEAEYQKRLDDEQNYLTHKEWNAADFCKIRLKRLDYYIRSFSAAFRELYLILKCKIQCTA